MGRGILGAQVQPCQPGESGVLIVPGMTQDFVAQVLGQVAQAPVDSGEICRVNPQDFLIVLGDRDGEGSRFCRSIHAP